MDLKPSTHSRIAAESHAPSCWAPRDAGAGAASLVKKDVAALEEATQRIDGFEERTRLEAEVVAPPPSSPPPLPSTCLLVLSRSVPHAVRPPQAQRARAALVLSMLQQVLLPLPCGSL